MAQGIKYVNLRIPELSAIQARFTCIRRSIQVLIFLL